MTGTTLDDHGGRVEELGLLFARTGVSRMAGRVLAFLMMSNESQVSTAELRRELRISSGSVSMATRELIERGQIREVAVPGSRSRHYRAEDDAWGGLLAAERRDLARLADRADELLAALGPEEHGPRVRLELTRDYHRWLQGVHRQLHERWVERSRNL